MTLLLKQDEGVHLRAQLIPLCQSLNVQQLRWHTAPDRTINEELPDVLVGPVGDAVKPGVGVGKLLEHLRQMVVKYGLGPVAVVRNLRQKQQYTTLLTRPPELS
jgi:hypothetical protein